MQTRQLCRTQMARRIDARARTRRIPMRALLLGGFVAAGLLIAGRAPAQQPLAGSLFAQAGSSGQPMAGELSAATIRKLQHSLIQGGYAIDAADGVWGPKTAAAVREFQRIKGLKPTGRADSQTLAALGVTADGMPPAVQQSTGAGAGTAMLPPVRARTPADLGRGTIRAIQQALNNQGLQVGPVDGAWGDKTVSAIGNFQRNRGMAASGELDAHTLAALGLLPGGSQAASASRNGQVPRPADLDPAAIRMIQQALSRHGYKVGAADGVWGDRTVEALRDFQRSRGIEPLGEPDVYTLVALELLPGSEKRPAAGRQPR